MATRDLSPAVAAIQCGYFGIRTLNPVYERRRRLFGLLGTRLVRVGWTPATGWDFLKNAATTQGLNYLLEAGFKTGATIIGDWRLGLIDNAGFTGVAPGDLMSSHAGWVEFTNYSGTDRPAWTPAAAANGEMPGTGAVTFTVGTGGGTVRGIFLTSGTAKGGNTGTLWCTAPDSAGRTVAASQAQQVFYTNALVPRS